MGLAQNSLDGNNDFSSSIISYYRCLSAKKMGNCLTNQNLFICATHDAWLDDYISNADYNAMTED